MPSYPQLFDETDTVPQSVAILTGDVDGGTVYVLPIVHLWNDKGALHGDATVAHGIVIRAKVNGAEEGVPILDGRWLGVEVIGMNNTADPSMQNQVTSITRLGKNSAATVMDISPDCSRYLRFTFAPPPGCDNQLNNVVIEITVKEDFVLLPLRLGTVAGGGIVPDWQDASVRRLVRGGGITADGSDTITIDNRSIAYDGTLKTFAAETYTPDQDAADGALAVGQKYIARVSQPSAGTVTVMKSNKGAAPDVPDVPADEIDLGYVTVFYQAGGTSVIVAGNVSTVGVLYGEYSVTPGAGLNVVVGGGSAIAETDFGPTRSSSSTVALTDDAANVVWLAANGTCVSNTTGAPPSRGAQPLAAVVTAGGAIISIVDLRRFVGRAIAEALFEFSIDTPAADAVTVPRVIAFDAYLESVDVAIGDVGTDATAGAFRFDILTWAAGTSTGGAGTTIYTSFATDDERPLIDFDAASQLSRGNRGHEVVVLPAGTWVAMKIVEVPADVVAPANAVGVLHLRRK